MKNPLDNSLGFQIVVAARSMKRALEIKLSEYNITSSQYSVLEILGKYNGISLTELGKLLYFDNPTITGIINRMARAKLLRRQRDRNDRRVIKLYLTPKGLELQSKLPKLAKNVNQEAVKSFKDSEIETILEQLKRINKSSINNR